MSNSSKFNFKSSGVKKGNKPAQRQISTIVNYGIKTPISNISGKHLFDMHTDASAQLKDNMKNLIMTNHGERLGLVNFGANLYPLLFDLTSTTNIDEEITKRIMEAVDHWMPAITVDDVEILEMDRTEKTLINKKSMTKVKLRVIFSAEIMGIRNLAIDVALVPGG